jgi:UDP-N-acetylglucosamine--N-acetylmuramyl-(pentapeptide) pyrophosphoryl-undecaprenol N-acetylglucosamine transferase
MRILCVGGGSGGHITPIVAITESIRKQKPRVDIRVWCDRSFVSQARQLLGADTRVDVVVSGKYRRYANISLLSHIRYHLIKTHLANFLDLFKIGFGFLQSLCKLIIWRPNVVFCKGGFVCLPVGVAAHFLRIPLVIHDSDVVPGLTNRILARYASYIGTGVPLENYPNYPRAKTKFVGIPVRPEFHKLSAAEKLAVKEKYGFSKDKKLVFVTGGGLGSSDLNEAVIKKAPQIINHNTQILLLTGENRDVVDPTIDGLRLESFLTDDYPNIVASADIVITRAGATAMAELASLGAVAIIVPNPFLAGDHQTKNALIWQQANAAIVIEQKNLRAHPDLLLTEVVKLLNDEKLRLHLSHNLAKFARPNALDQMVEMILGAVK